MRLGVCTTDFPRMEAARLTDKCASFGFRSAQVSFASFVETGFLEDGGFEITYNVPKRAVSDIRRALSDSGIFPVSVNGTFNCAHPNPVLRGEGVARFEGFTDAVCEIGSPYISLCTGTRNTEHLWRSHPENDTDEAWDDMQKTVAMLVRIAKKKDLVLAVETEASNVVNSPEKARRLLDEIASPNLKMILDGANLFNPTEAKPENAHPILDRAFACFGNDIVMAHGKDIKAGNGIEFCATGEGIVDFAYMAQKLAEIGFDGDFLLHGIYDEAKFPAAISHIKQFIRFD